MSTGRRHDPLVSRARKYAEQLPALRAPAARPCCAEQLPLMRCGTLKNSRNHMFPMCITLWVSLWEIGGFQKLCTLTNSRELISLKSMT